MELFATVCVYVCVCVCVCSCASYVLSVYRHRRINNGMHPMILYRNGSPCPFGWPWSDEFLAWKHTHQWLCAMQDTLNEHRRIQNCLCLLCVAVWYALFHTCANAVWNALYWPFAWVVIGVSQWWMLAGFLILLSYVGGDEWLCVCQAVKLCILIINVSEVNTYTHTHIHTHIHTHTRTHTHTHIYAHTLHV